MLTADFTPTVATVLEPTERPRLDAAAQGCFAALHTDSVPEAIRAVRERPVDAVLISPRCVPTRDLPRLASLVRGFPGMPTVAVLSRHDASSSARLLDLGATGVRRIVDLSERTGWQRLRDFVAHPASPAGARILARVIPALGEPSDDARAFFQALVRLAPGVTTVRTLAAHFGLPPSTFMSRFFRAGLPSPKRYLAATRVLFAAALFEVRGLSIADVAYRLEYSSPQSFGRHLRATIGVTAGAFRRHHTFAQTAEGYCASLIVPFRAVYRTFHPLDHTGVAILGRSE